MRAIESSPARKSPLKILPDQVIIFRSSHHIVYTSFSHSFVSDNFCFVFTISESASSAEGGEEAAEESKGIPGFWLACLLNHPAIGELITEEDVPAMEALADIKCEYSEDYTSFTLTFCFKPNDYFNNAVGYDTIQYFFKLCFILSSPFLISISISILISNSMYRR